jgi:hypothetical protein
VRQLRNTQLSSISKYHENREHGWCIQATGVLVEALLDRGADGDVAEADAAIDRLAVARSTNVSRRARSCCGYGRCSRGPAATRWLTGIWSIVSRDGDSAWLRRTCGDGRGDELTATGLDVTGGAAPALFATSLNKLTNAATQPL